MTSNIDITKPEAGQATTQSVRDNFSAAKTEIDTLQSQSTSYANKTQHLDASGNFSGGTVTGLTAPLAVADGGTGATTVAGVREALKLGMGTATLNVSGTTTNVADTAVTADSKVILYPVDVGAASCEGIGSYVSAVSAGVGFTVTHAVYSGARNYNYHIIG